MSFLEKNILECLSAKVTDLGRKRISEGNFDIAYFKVGDSEYDYNFSVLDQSVMHPVEKDADLKYPLLMDGVTQIDYGTVAADHSTVTLTEELASKGLVSGSTVTCAIYCFDLNTVSGTTIELPSGSTLPSNCDYVLFSTQTAVSSTPVITGNTVSAFYKVVSISGTTLTVDRTLPDYSGEAGMGFVVCMNCNDAANWKMNIPWTEKPAGLDDTYENLSGYGSNQFTSAKEYFGYTSVSGQTDNTSTTFVNSVGEVVVVAPREQKTIAVIHYSGENFDHYEDWLAHDSEAQEYFELHIPFLLYHRATGTTIGQVFHMSSDAGYVRSAVNNSPTLGEKYHYLVDEAGNRVGKIFVYKRVVVIDDQEIVAALSMKSNRSWTLPAPKCNLVPMDLPCVDGSTDPLLSGTTKDIWITYAFDYEYDPAKNGLHCNYYTRLSGTTGTHNVSLKFGDEFSFMVTDGLEGFKATKLWVLMQLTNAGELPTPDDWIKTDITSQIPNHTIGNAIDGANIPGVQYTLTRTMYDEGSLYELADLLGAQPLQGGGADLLQFGDERVFPGSIKATRATNVHEMSFLVNLPASQFTVSQNPTKLEGVSPRITEIGLFNKNMELMVIGKAASPHTRTGFQQYALKIDF